MSTPDPRRRTDLYVWERKALWVLLAACFGMKATETVIGLATALHP